MFRHIIILVLLSAHSIGGMTISAMAPTDSIPELENPMSVDYLKNNLEKKLPRLVLNRQLEKQLKKKMKTDPVLQNMSQAIMINAKAVREEALLKRKKTGRRLLSVSREMLYRINMLGMAYRLDGDRKWLDRIDREVVAVCNFKDWNPSHYLDVAEMAMAVAFALDWTAGDLPQPTIQLAKKALKEKGIEPSYNEKGNTGWVTGTNNWNQVCHGGMIAAALTIAEDEPELAARTISRALDGMPHALVEYGPDGVYPEGSTYWGYGTAFSVLTAAMLESAFGTDFGLGKYPGFRESAVFRSLSNAPSGWYYNFADCGDKRSENGDLTLAWFAAKMGNPVYFEKERFLRPPQEMGKLARHAGAAMVWLSQFEAASRQTMPRAWQGGGANPIFIFKDPADAPQGYYLGGKGGRGTVPHGNMDAGSFIFELNGVRWITDPGNQRYHDLEKTGFNLWGRCQECERWLLLTKNNYGHSTLTVDDKLHVVDGMATITSFEEGQQPEVSIDLTPVFAGQLKSAGRRFVRDSPTSLLIEDRVEVLPSTRMVNWQFMTTADVEMIPGGVVLHQDGQSLKMSNLSHENLSVSIISLDPPPHPLDRRIPGLKRVEWRYPAHLLAGGENTIRIHLAEQLN